MSFNFTINISMFTKVKMYNSKNVKNEEKKSVTINSLK